MLAVPSPLTSTHIHWFYLGSQGQTNILGVMMSDDASFKDQIEKVAKKVRQKTGWVLRKFYSRKTLLMKTLFKTLVVPHIARNCGCQWNLLKSWKLKRYKGTLWTGFQPWEETTTGQSWRSWRWPRCKEGRREWYTSGRSNILIWFGESLYLITNSSHSFQTLFMFSSKLAIHNWFSCLVSSNQNWHAQYGLWPWLR